MHANIRMLRTMKENFKNSFFLSSISQENKLDINFHNTEFLVSFKSNLLKFIRPFSNSVYNSHNLKGIRLLTKFRLELDYLRDRKSRHNCLKSTVYFSLHCHNYITLRQTLFGLIGPSVRVVTSGRMI